MLRRQYFSRREHGHLVSVLDSDDRGLRGHDGFPAAHVALQKAVHRAGRGHVTSDLAQYALLSVGGFEREHGLDPLAYAIVEFERNTDLLPRFPASGQ